MQFCSPGYLSRNLSAGRLIVNATFGCQDKVTVVEKPVYVDVLHDYVVPGPKPSSDKTQPGAESPGRPAPGAKASFLIAKKFRGNLGEPIHGIGQELHLGHRRTLLRSKDGGNASVSAQDIVPIDSSINFCLPDPFVHSRKIDAMELGERFATGSNWKVVAVTIQQPCTKCLQHASAAIACPRVSTAEKNPRSTCINGSKDQFTNAVCGGGAGITLSARNKTKARSSRHLYDGGAWFPNLGA
jgi:hypothetical protein